MSRQIAFLSFCLAFISLTLAAQVPDLSGTWVSDANTSQKLVLAQHANKLQVQELNGDKVEANFTCSTDGQQCAIKEDGHSEKITMYFNGAKLVQLRERGSETTKSRLTLSPDGKTLTVETVPLSATEKPESVSFRRQST